MGPLPSVTDDLAHDGFAFDSQIESAYTTCPQQIDDSIPAATLPDLVESRPAQTPPADEPACPNMNTSVGGTLAPVPSPAPRRSSKAGSDLRL